jgi:hypothetical protein
VVGITADAVGIYSSRVVRKESNFLNFQFSITRQLGSHYWGARHPERPDILASNSAKKRLPESTGPRGAEDTYLFRERLVGRHFASCDSAVRRCAAIHSKHVAGLHADSPLRGPQRHALARSRCRRRFRAQNSVVSSVARGPSSFGFLASALRTRHQRGGRICQSVGEVNSCFSATLQGLGCLAQELLRGDCPAPFQEVHFGGTARSSQRHRHAQGFPLTTRAAILFPVASGLALFQKPPHLVRPAKTGGERSLEESLRDRFLSF